MSEFESAFDEDLINDLMGSSDAEFELRVVSITDKHAKDLVQEFATTYPSVKVLSAQYTDDPRVILDGADVVLIECRVLEGFNDLKLINQIRSARPLIPIIALSPNMDSEFIMAAYENGVVDYLNVDIPSELLLAKIRTVYRLSEAARFLETKNQEVVDTMRSLRSSKEKLKNEINSRINAETQKEFAEELASINQQNKEILDNLREAFFIVQSDLRIGESTSASCRSLFGCDIGCRELGQALNLAENKEDYIRLTMEQLFENFMPLEVTMGLFPTRVSTQDGKILDLKYTLVSDKDQTPKKVIVVATDMTEGVRREKQFVKKMKLVNCLFSILQNHSAFEDFLYDFKRDLATMRESMHRETVLRILHTIKGNAGVYHMDFMSRRIHSIETLITKSEMDDPQFFAYIQTVVYDIEKRMERFIDKHHAILGMSYRAPKRDQYIVTGRQIKNLTQIASDIEKLGKTALLDEISALRYRPLSILSSSLVQVAKRTAKKLNKKVHVGIEGGEFRGDLEMLSPLFRNLVHIINNACDHGIEATEDRASSQKPPVGHINISFKPHDHGLGISIEDDGQGMSRDRLIEVARHKKLMTDAELNKLSDEQAFHLIFLDGFSTSATVSDTSGRGVGMSAVKAEIERLGGEIHIHSVEGKGTRFSLFIPKVTVLDESGEAAA